MGGVVVEEKVRRTVGHDLDDGDRAVADFHAAPLVGVGPEGAAEEPADDVPVADEEVVRDLAGGGGPGIAGPGALELRFGGGGDHAGGDADARWAGFAEVGIALHGLPPRRQPQVPPAAALGLSDDPQWYRTAVFYEVMLRNFSDSSAVKVSRVALSFTSSMP